MSKKNNNIIMTDWTGKVLFHGNYKSKEVDKVLIANKCKHCNKPNYADGIGTCPVCGDTGYAGDFSVEWEDADTEDNVYEYINY